MSETKINAPETMPGQPVATDRPASGLSKHMRFTFFAHGIILPCNLFGMSLMGQSAMIDAPWQSGNVGDYLAMLLKPAGWAPFAPAVLLSMISLMIWTIVPSAGRNPLIRLGIYTGVVLTMQFCGLLLVLYHVPMLIVAVIVWCCWHGLLWTILFFWPKQFGIRHIMILMTLCAVIALLACQFPLRDLLIIPGGAYIWLTMASPPLSVCAYVGAARRVYLQAASEAGRHNVAILGGLSVWSIAWLVSWRLAIIAMLDEYAKLPVTNPNCYLSSAAAFGHPVLTGANKRGEITACMRRLKFLEIVLKLTMPRVHRFCRQWYDVCCPPLAALCRSHILLATATCICLMPVELVAELVRTTLRIEPERIRGIYGRLARLD